MPTRWLLVALATILPQVATANPVVESISPPVFEVGKTTRVTLVGRELANAEGLWFSVNRVTAKPVESEANSATFDVTVEQAAPVGIVGVRIATRNGLGNMCLALIDDLPVRISGETIAIPSTVWGTLREATVDRYAIDVKAGTTLSFEAVANRLGKDSDPLVTIRDTKQKVVAECDNSPGLYFDCRFEHTFAAAGRHMVEIRDARYHGGEHRKYALRIGQFPARRVALPTESIRGPAALEYVPLKAGHGSAWVPVPTSQYPITIARPLILPDVPPIIIGRQPLRAATAFLARRQFTPTFASVPAELWGTLPEPGWRATFAVMLAKGQRVHIRGDAKTLSSPADPEVIVQDAIGRELRRTGDADVETPFDFTAPNAGEYRLVVRDKQRDGGPDFAFRLTIRDTPFPPKLTAEAEGLTVPRGSYQEVPIIVTRTGTTGPIALSLRGAPSGVTLTPTKIDEKETAVVCRLSAAATAPLGLHTIQIVAEAMGAEPVLVTTQPLIDKRRVNVDLIPYALREDQRRLPPSVADRFVLLVTSPAPFAFELPQAVVVLPRYQRAAIPVTMTRVPGFDGPIRFTASGGQLADKHEGRTRVYAEFPDATADRSRIDGTAVSKILSNVAKARIEVRGTGTHSGRQVTLHRHFDLDLVPAFRVTSEPAKLALRPGETATVRLQLARVPSFDGPVTLRLTPQNELAFDETLIVAKGQNSLDLKVTANGMPRRATIPMLASATVDGYEEEVRVPGVEVEVTDLKKDK